MSLLLCHTKFINGLDVTVALLLLNLDYPKEDSSQNTTVLFGMVEYFYLQYQGRLSIDDGFASKERCFFVREIDQILVVSK